MGFTEINDTFTILNASSDIWNPKKTPQAKAAGSMKKCVPFRDAVFCSEREALRLWCRLFLTSFDFSNDMSNSMSLPMHIMHGLSCPVRIPIEAKLSSGGPPEQANALLEKVIASKRLRCGY